MIFEAEKVRFHYRLTDAFTRRLSGWAKITLDRPVFYADVPFTMTERRPSRTFELFSKLVAKVRNKTELVIRGGRISWAANEGTISGIEGTIEDREFRLSVSVNHLKSPRMDFSSQFDVNGRLENVEGRDRLAGSFQTRGTVVNWKPVAHESTLSYVLTTDWLEIPESNILGGVRVSGRIDYSERPVADLLVLARGYPLEGLNDIFILPSEKRLSGLANARLKLTGALTQPMVEGRVLVKDSRMGERPFKNMQLNLRGVLPELRISESRMVLPDGTTMNFANQTLHVREFLDTQTYERLVTRTDQTDVSWKDWRLSRMDTDDSVLLQREMGEMKFSYEKFQNDEADLASEEKKDESSLEYLIEGANSLKVQMKEEEEFIGVQRKVAF